jgi:hypothetical protein
MKPCYECRKPDCTADVNHGRRYCPPHQATWDSIVHGLRNAGWGKADAEQEADDRLGR